MLSIFVSLLWLVAGLLGVFLAAGGAYGLLAFSWFPSVICIWFGNRWAREVCSV